MSTAESIFWNLSVAAAAEGDVVIAEAERLARHAERLGLSTERAAEIRAEAVAKKPVSLRMPKDEMARLDCLRSVLEVAAADGSISPREFAIARAIATKAGVSEGKLQSMARSALRGVKRGTALETEAEMVEEIELAPAPPPPRRNEFVRSLPFVASGTRLCTSCGREFANRRAESRTCAVCEPTPESIADEKVDRFLGFAMWPCLVVAAIVLEVAFGTWGWAWTTASSWGSKAWSDTSGSYRRRRHQGTFALIAVVLPFGAAALATAAAGFALYIVVYAATRAVVGFRRSAR